MSSATNAINMAENVGNPAARAIRQADDGIGNWLTDLVTGAGSSPSHIIITGILGCIPGIGQAMDVRDIVLGVILISKSPKEISAWVNIVITLIGCVPAVGDALKVGFKLMKQGHNFGRVLEAVSPALRGNVEKFMRKIDWTMLASESKGLFSKVLTAFMDGLDSWAVRYVAGGPQVKLILGELHAIEKQAPKMIDEAFTELKLMHSKMLGHELPGSTAAVAGTSSKIVKEEVEQTTKAAAGKEAKAAAKEEKTLLVKKSNDKNNNKVTPNTTKIDQKKAAKKKPNKNKNGILAEHLTDYHVKNTYRYPKENNNGRNTEHKDRIGTGLDHLWSHSAHPEKPFIVGETKSSIFDAFSLMMALPEDLREKFNILKADEAANPLPNGKPSTPINEKRDEYAGTSVEIGDTAEHEKEVRKGLNKPKEKTSLATQMSHKWIERALSKEKLTAKGKELARLIKNRRNDLFIENKPFPYQRWISLVTGRQFTLHGKPKGHKHQIQLKLELPDKILME